MYAICVTAAVDKENLPRMMLYAVRAARALGDLDGLIHAKDDVIRELKYGWEMTSYWDTPDPEMARKLSRSMVYIGCLEMAIDMLYDCRKCDNWPEINVVLGKIEERLEGLE